MDNQNLEDKSLNFASLMVNPILRNAVKGMTKKWKPASPLAKVVKDFYAEMPRSNHAPADMELDLYLKSKNFDESSISLAIMLKNRMELTVDTHGIDSLISSFLAKCRYDMVKDIHRQFNKDTEDGKPDALDNYIKNIGDLNNMGGKRLNVMNFAEIDMAKFINERVNAPKRLIKSKFSLIKETCMNGAYEKGWLVQVVAPSNCGKTMWLLNEAIHFAEDGLKVFWTTLGDMTDIKMLERVCCIVTQTNMMEITDQLSELSGLPEVRKVMSNIDFVFEHANELTASDVINSVLNHESDGKQYDVVIVDYDDNFKSEGDGGGDSMYLKGGNSYAELVRLAQNGMGTLNPNFKLVFVAAQAKPELWGQEELPLNCAACSSQKPMKADMTIAINKNSIVPHVGTMSVVKHRHGHLLRAKYAREEYGVFRGIDKREYDAIINRHAYRDNFVLDALPNSIDPPSIVEVA